MSFFCVLSSQISVRRSPIVFKIVVIVTLLMWLVYDLSVLNYVAVFFDTLTTITNTITLYKMKKGAAL